LFSSGGVKGRWVRNAVHDVKQHLMDFRPDIVWCTFGMMEAVFAARRIARDAPCPWILDIKDNWELFVPSGMRRLMVWRTRGWAAVTTNAGFTAARTIRWQRTGSEVIYSGVEDAFFRVEASAFEGPSAIDIVLAGSLYFATHLGAVLNGIAQWFNSLPMNERCQVTIRYAGGDVALFEQMVKKTVPHLRAEALGYLPIQEFAHLCRRSNVNIYLAHPAGFHHKLLELLACDRPILVCPAESEESKNLAREHGGELIEAATESDVAERLSRIIRDSGNRGLRVTSAANRIHRYTWRQQARLMEAVLLGVSLRRKKQ
jgi:hypothetical protein